MYLVRTYILNPVSPFFVRILSATGLKALPKWPTTEAVRLCSGSLHSDFKPRKLFSPKILLEMLYLNVLPNSTLRELESTVTVSLTVAQSNWRDIGQDTTKIRTSLLFLFQFADRHKDERMRDEARLNGYRGGLNHASAPYIRAIFQRTFYVFGENAHGTAGQIRTIFSQEMPRWCSKYIYFREAGGQLPSDNPGVTR
ncbi:hypothetical protein DFH06DRAFT_1122379 [Mycena polygramma]|nr:hypothetical protein DFH06DRAFT_1122379 [Mycena polygramma]